MTKQFSESLDLEPRSQIVDVAAEGASLILTAPGSDAYFGISFVSINSRRRCTADIPDISQIRCLGETSSHVSSLAS